MESALDEDDLISGYITLDGPGRERDRERERERSERERERREEYEKREGKEKSLKNRCAKIVCLQ